ncbi:unnamed protein product [Notodromas monacha]|uniref:Trafficking protein particle complex subunit 2-like protein n=1 Tax=Notodromas monacha TaxID=399045 RepID=A0A7R9BP20_9CRUS|nr:unnamed protein product [Notodromas monacha]CAG0919064.1 unnamed protein product [Notodromas monacha]
MAKCIAVLGKENSPLFLQVADPSRELDFHRTVCGCMDVVEERLAAFSKPPQGGGPDFREQYLGLLHTPEEFRVEPEEHNVYKAYGYVTNTRIKFMIIWDASDTSLRENDVKGMFRRLHNVYTELVCNPFYIPGDTLNCKKLIEMAAVTVTKPLDSPDVEDDDDIFLDADEAYDDLDLEPISLESSSFSLDQSIDLASRALDLFLSNRFLESKRLMDVGKNSSMYHALGSGTFAFLQAVMTMNESELESAVAALKASVQVCARFRKKESVKQTVSKLVRGKKYASYTEEERHAELCYAEGILEKAILTFLEDETLSSFVKGALQIRHGYFAYRECWNILKEKPMWTNDKLQNNFESGVRLGVGAFNLLISMLPGRVLKILEWIGFSGTKELGLSQLEKSFECDGALRSVLSALVLLGYHTFICFFAGVGDGDVPKAKSIVQDMLKKYPNGAFFLFFSGRVELVSGNVELAMEEYQKSIDSQDELIQFHHFCFWELIWCNMFVGNWNEASKNAKRLLTESKWSRCFYAYCQASCISMKATVSAEDKEEIEELMRRVPKYKQRIAGKSVPIEKFCVRKAERFFAQGSYLVLPAFELIFVWNGFAILSRRQDLLERIYSRILDTKKQIEDEKLVDNFKTDNLCLCNLLAGCCLRWMGLPTLAEEYFEEALKCNVVEDKYLLPYAAAELGYLYLSQGQNERAKKQLQFARSNFVDYSLESRLHFRVHVALTKVSELEKKSDENKC